MVLDEWGVTGKRGYTGGTILRGPGSYNAALAQLYAAPVVDDQQTASVDEDQGAAEEVEFAAAATAS